MGYSLEGIGLARPAIAHQRFSRNIVINWYLLHGFKVIEAFQEGTANHKTTGQEVPDVTFVNRALDKVVVSIEIEKSFSKRLIAKIEESHLLRHKHMEAFALNYRTGKWRRYILANKQLEMEETDFSEVLGVHLSKYLYLENS
jgi:hypothetical protein